MSTQITTTLLCDGCLSVIKDAPGLSLQKDGGVLDFHDSDCLKLYGDNATLDHQQKVAAAEASLEVLSNG